LKILIIKEIKKLIILLHILAIRILFPRKQRGPAAIDGIEGAVSLANVPSDAGQEPADVLCKFTC